MFAVCSMGEKSPTNLRLMTSDEEMPENEEHTSETD